ncbi:molybdenum cofactor biosynthesis prote [Clavulina sp. PMI_390]|nr:molybdenum cofactor biosynthesis prote [Clavulina sp. PMI_390]
MHSLPPPPLIHGLRNELLRRLSSASVLHGRWNHSLSVSERAKHRISQIDSQLGDAGKNLLFDTYHRKHDYLRISLTERCNLRCFYCMPSDGVELSPKDHILSDDEIIRLATIFVRRGVNKIRLTGGEPTVRKGIVELVGRLNELRSEGLQSIGMTSNGIALLRKLGPLSDNGLTHLNLSLDTLDPYMFELITRRQGHGTVLRTLDEALSIPKLQSVKLNVVVMKGINEHEVPKFVELSKERNVSVRFIEFMPFNGNSWRKDKLVPSHVLLERIRELYPNVTKGRDSLNDTARSYEIPDHRGSFGFISSMSDHFCGSCNRLRLTADGQIKVCLFDPEEVSLRDAMRAGASDDVLSSIISKALSGKKEKHSGMEEIDVMNNRPMILIGASSSPALRSTHLMRSSSPRNLFLPRARGFSTSVRQYKFLTHIDNTTGRPNMVNVSDKKVTNRVATASGRILLNPTAFNILSESKPGSSHGTSPVAPDDDEIRAAEKKARAKGNVLVTAQLAAIMAAKQTSSLIPLCHPLPLTHATVDFVLEPDRRAVRCVATVKCDGKTGVEMEALTAVSVGLLTVWDMLKAVAGKDMAIQDVMVIQKSGGASGDWTRPVAESESL